MFGGMGGVVVVVSFGGWWWWMECLVEGVMGHSAVGGGSRLR